MPPLILRCIQLGRFFVVVAYLRKIAPSNSIIGLSHNVLCSSIDEICGDLNQLKQNLNLPIVLNDDQYPTVDECNLDSDII